MSSILVRIKRVVLSGHYAFSEKARIEMEAEKESFVIRYGINITYYNVPGL